MKKFLLLIRQENSDYANKKYIEAIEKFGGKVVLIYDYYGKEECLDYLKEVVGILLPGGDCVGPLDFFLIEYALDNNLKLLGICQGMQSMALYGSSDKLIDIGNMNHKQDEGYIHNVNLCSGKLMDIYGEKIIKVNSHHLQTVKNSYFFSVVGKSNDGLIEAIESNNNIFQIGVQWHPERMLEYDVNSFKLLKEFIVNK